MKAGDLLVWTKYASEWSDGPEEGTIAGVFIKAVRPNPLRRNQTPDRVKLLLAGTDFITDTSILNVEVVK
tara:strand:- start:292 stop:501 length:210 start_codon:yes stop_codon:yes gene_type:complete